MKWILVALMVLHGAIHLMGAFGELGIAKFEGPPVRTLFTLSEKAKRAFGYAWFIPVFLFLAAAVGLVFTFGWWKPVAVAAVILSQALIVIWWPAAKFGTIANILILTGVLLL